MANTGPSQSSVAQTPSGGPRRHSKYYYADGNVIFLIEHVLFRIHRYLFITHSKLFATMFSLPDPPVGSEGQSDDNPVRLQVKALDFERLLWFLYPETYGANSEHRKAPIEEWISILDLSTMLQFDGIREHVIAKLESGTIPPVERIALAHKYSIPGWVFAPFVALARRDESLSVAEAMMLGVENMALLAQAREILRSSATYACLRCGSSGRGAMVTASSQAASEKVVMEVFGMSRDA